MDGHGQVTIMGIGFQWMATCQTLVLIVGQSVPRIQVQSPDVRNLRAVEAACGLCVRGGGVVGTARDAQPAKWPGESIRTAACVLTAALAARGAWAFSRASLTCKCCKGGSAILAPLHIVRDIGYAIKARPDL